MRLLLIAGVVVLIAVPFLAQQQPPIPTLKDDVDMVLVNLTVTDSLKVCGWSEQKNLCMGRQN
jgi:hypothetical protein